MTTTEEEKNFFIYLRKPTIHTLTFEIFFLKFAVTVTTLEKSKTITTTFKISNSKTEF